MNSNSANTFLHISSSYESLPKPSFSDHDIELMTLTIRDFLEIPQIDPPIISLGTVCEKSLECGAIDMKPPLTLRLHNILENSFQSGNNLTLPGLPVYTENDIFSIDIKKKYQMTGKDYEYTRVERTAYKLQFKSLLERLRCWKAAEITSFQKPVGLKIYLADDNYCGKIDMKSAAILEVPPMTLDVLTVYPYPTQENILRSIKQGRDRDSAIPFLPHPRKISIRGTRLEPTSPPRVTLTGDRQSNMLSHVADANLENITNLSLTISDKYQPFKSGNRWIQPCVKPVKAKQCFNPVVRQSLVDTMMSNVLTECSKKTPILPNLDLTERKEPQNELLQQWSSQLRPLHTDQELWCAEDLSISSNVALAFPVTPTKAQHQQQKNGDDEHNPVAEIHTLKQSVRSSFHENADQNYNALPHRVEKRQALSADDIFAFAEDAPSGASARKRRKKSIVPSIGITEAVQFRHSNEGTTISISQERLAEKPKRTYTYIIMDPTCLNYYDSLPDEYVDALSLLKTMLDEKANIDCKILERNLRENLESIILSPSVCIVTIDPTPGSVTGHAKTWFHEILNFFSTRFATVYVCLKKAFFSPSTNPTFHSEIMRFQRLCFSLTVSDFQVHIKYYDSAATLVSIIFDLIRAHSRCVFEEFFFMDSKGRSFYDDVGILEEESVQEAWLCHLPIFNRFEANFLASKYQNFGILVHELRRSDFYTDEHWEFWKKLTRESYPV